MSQVRVLESRRPFGQNLRALTDYRDLLANWIVREIKGRYRQSVFGVGWIVIQPLIQMAVISTIFGGILRVPSDGLPYPVFAFAALVPWTFFSSSITAAVPSLIGNMDLVTKVYFPREILPVAAVLARLVDFCAALAVFGVLLWWFGLPLPVTAAVVPLLLLIQIAFTIGVAILGAGVSVFVRDVSFALPLGLQIWMYCTPIIYPVSLVPESWRPVYFALNPMAIVVDAYRGALLAGAWPDWTMLGWAALVSAVLCLTSYAYFKRLELAMSEVI